MKITFPDQDTATIVDKLQAAMGDRALAKIVSFSHSKDQLIVTLSKLGKSVLTFDRSGAAGGSEFVLTKEKIAFAHKPMKADVTSKIVQVAEKAGGTVTS